MKTQLRSVHEETYSDGSRTLGVLLNYSDEDNFKESLTYIFREDKYIFFNTIIDMIDYLLYGEIKMKRAYMEEDVFDSYLDAEYIEGKFSDILVWC